MSIKPIQLDQVGVRQNLKTVGICEQLDTANAFPNEGLEQLSIAGPEKSRDRDEMLRGELSLLE
jgi:hypothetical protein